MVAAPLLRLARAVVFATVCAGLGVLAHLFAGGTVSPETAAWAQGLSLLAALPLTGRERGLRVILPLLAGVQAGMHVVFALVDATPSGDSVIGHLHCAVPGFGMTILHGVAVILTAVWLARGEAGMWALLLLAGARVIRLIFAWLLPEPEDGRGPVPVFPEVPRPGTVLLGSVVRRRGPPAGAFCR
ncbi:MFS transporter [Streptosporangium sp. NPDC051023]|uniref:MFS transporter n=1 Tax=Streptosporangium sp. NPDC051023 TaxID=3155410 RepID=UPI00344D06A9